MVLVSAGQRVGLSFAGGSLRAQVEQGSPRGAVSIHLVKSLPRIWTTAWEACDHGDSTAQHRGFVYFPCSRLNRVKLTEERQTVPFPRTQAQQFAIHSHSPAGEGALLTR